MPGGTGVIAAGLLALLALLAGCRTSAPLPPPVDPWTTPEPAFATSIARPAPPPASAPALERAPVSLTDLPEPSEPSGYVSPWAAEVDLGLYSRYVWRGFLVTDDPVIQGSVTVDYKDLSFNVWGNVDTTDANGTEWDLNEINLTLDYGRAFAIGCVDLEWSVGAIGYFFPITDTPTLLEVYAGISADVLLQPSLFVYREVLDQEYTYAAFDIGHAFDLGRPMLDLAAGVGWGDHNWHRVLHGVSGESFHEFHARAALDIPVGCFTISPTVWWSSLFRSEVREAQPKSDLWVVALVVSYGF